MTESKGRAAETEVEGVRCGVSSVQTLKKAGLLHREGKKPLLMIELAFVL